MTTPTDTSEISLRSVFDLIFERTEQYWAAEMARIEAMSPEEVDAELARVEAEGRVIDAQLRLRARRKAL